MSKRYKVIGILAGLALFFVGIYVPASAQTATTSTPSAAELIQTLKQQIEALKAQIVLLQEQLSVVIGTRSQIRETGGEITTTLRLLKHLKTGMTGEEVKMLQEILATDPEIYPEGLKTGLFGPLTEKAVKRFQKKFGIEQVGIVGPKTLFRINQILSRGAGKFKHIPGGLLKKFESGEALELDEEKTVTICHIPGGNPDNKHTLIIGKPALSAHLKHGDTAGACEGDGGDGEEEDATPPVISSVTASGITASTTNITWTTNEAATSKAWYGTTTPLVLTAPTLMVQNTNLVTSHSLSLTSLAASTTYYYVVSSADSKGNLATSSEALFLTSSE